MNKLVDFGFDTSKLYDSKTVIEQDPYLVRLVTNEEGEQVKNLLTTNGYQFPDSLDWSQLYPYWIGVIEPHDESDLLGVIQVSAGRPVGSVEFLSVLSDLPKNQKALVIRDLLIAAFASLKASGCQFAYGFVSFKRKDFKKLLKRKFGVTSVATGNILTKDLMFDRGN